MGASPAVAHSLTRWEWVLDIAAVIALIAGISQVVSGGGGIEFVELALAAAAVCARRCLLRTSAGLALACSAAVFAHPGLAVPVWVMAEVVLFSLAIRARRKTAVAIGAAHALLLYAGAIVVFRELPYEPVALVLPVWTCAVVATGLALRANADSVEALKERAAVAIAHRENEIARRVGEERLRIARDLHDSVAHAVSVIAVHAGAASRHIGENDARARESVTLVRETSRRVIEELQDIVTVLRADHPEERDTAEVPGVAGIPALIDTARSAGMQVDFTQGDLPPMEVAVELALFRILQEALTNARKHGDGGVRVAIEATQDRVFLKVSNTIEASSSGGAGFGLVGMRERADSVHGEFAAEASSGEWQLCAILPLHARDGGAR
ncbi:sensor histidine kinase [Leucobacter musarum]|uniref:sensor histidine kinase n=1 Tax=Leucobacter musarum TaxID=1930747 RepID=UPI000A630568|nr:histidine kinase [Leucobacter musarum]